MAIIVIFSSWPQHTRETSWWLASWLVYLFGLNKSPILNLSFLGSLEVCFETIPGDGRGPDADQNADLTRTGPDADDGNSDNKAISVQLSLGLTELGKSRG